MINRMIIHGRITRDVELKKTPSDISVCKFSVAVDRAYSPKGEDKQTDFFDCVAWRGLADMISKYFSKGKEIAVEGRMESRHYEDKSGNKRVAWEIIVDNVDFCGSKSDSVQSEAAPSPPTAQNTSSFLDAPIDSEDGDLPF